MKKNYTYTISENQTCYTSSRLWRIFALSLFCFLLSPALSLHAQSGTSNELANNEAIVWLTTPGSGRILDCYYKEITIISTVHRDGVNLDAGATFQWTGPDGFSSDKKDIIVTKPGIYRVVAKTANGLIGSNSIEILGEDYPKKFAGPDLAMYPSDKTVQLQGYSHGYYDIVWEASNGGNMVSGGNTPTPIVDAPGTYTIILTERLSGCTMRDTMVVTASEPVLTAHIWTDNTRGFDCGVDVIYFRGRAELVGRSAPEGFSYSWSGPDNFTSTQQNVSVTEPGTYTLQVTDNATGESASDSWTLSAPRRPDASAGPDKVLTCANPTVTLEGTMTSGDHVIWLASDGGNIVSNWRTLNPVVDAPGTYTMRVYFYITSCTAEYTVKVTRGDELTVSATGGKLNNGNGTVQLKGSSNFEDVTYSWAGPSGYTSNEQNPVVSEAGDYTLTASKHGCTATTTVTVDPPKALAKAQNGKDVRVYPNPVKDRAQIEFKLKNKENYVVNLYDMNGNLVRELGAGTTKTGGPLSIVFDVSDLSDGLYIARIVSTSETKTVQLIVKK